MTNERQLLMNRMIRIYGAEHPITIAFCRLCKQWAINEWNNQCLTTLVKAHEESPQINNESEYEDA